MIGKDSALDSRIYGRVCASTPGTIWTSADFVDFGTHMAVTKALQRLAATGSLRRIERGLYDRPQVNRLTGKISAPDYRAVIDAIARRDQKRMLVDGMTAANDLGLSDAVPGQVIVHTDGRTKNLRLGNLTITFRPTSASKLFWAGRPAMRLVQALQWLKPQLHSHENSRQLRRKIESLLFESALGPSLRKDLLKGRRSMPAWMRDYLHSLILPGGTTLSDESKAAVRNHSRKGNHD